MRDFYPYGFRLDNQEHLLVWFCEDAEPDGVIVNDGRLVSHADLDGLYDYARVTGLRLVDDTELSWVDLDAIAFWTVVGDEVEPDCVELLNAWNLFSDAAHSLGVPLQVRSAALDQVYDKVFWGNNLPMMTPVGESFEPTWSDAELLMLRETMNRGLDVIRQGLRAV
ncbi:MAG: hypothetical protein ABIS86_09110 [Streptosporangiaceae bacterium]